MEENRSLYAILAKKHEDKCTVNRPRSRYEGNIEHGTLGSVM
jgi:hypothetical protein